MKHIVILFSMLAVCFTGCKSTHEDLSTVKPVPSKVASAYPAYPRKVVPSLKVSVTSNLPKCERITEYWGSVYLKLTDVNGYIYKFACPMVGTSSKYKTRTGWYLLSSDGKIIQYQDKPKKR